MSTRQNRLPEFQSKEYLRDKSSMPTVNIVAEKNNQGRWGFRPDASSITALSNFLVKTPRASHQKIKISIQADGREIGTTELAPITTIAGGRDDAGVLSWIRAGYKSGAVPSFPEPELQIYRQIYYHEMQQGALTEAVKLNTERDYQQGVRKNLTESELNRLILSTGVVDGKNESHFRNEQDITEMLAQDQNLGNPEVFSSDYFTVLRKMKEKGFTLPGQDLVLGSFLQVHLFDKGRYILFNNHGGYTVETEPSILKNMTPEQKQSQKTGDIAWTEKLKKMFTASDVHQNPITLSRGLLANSRNMQLREEGKHSADKNVNVLRNLGTRLETLTPHDPNNPSRSAEIGKSNLKTWEKTFLSLTYAVKNDVVDEVDKEQQLAIDNAIAAGNKLTTREAVANGVGDPWEAAKTYLPLVAIPGLVYLLMKFFKIGDKGGVGGFVRDMFGMLTVLGIGGAAYGIYKSTAGAALKEKALGTPEEPEKTPSTTEKQMDSIIGQWQAKHENGVAWTEILQSTPELTKPRNRGGFAIGDLMVALHPNDARYTGLNSIKTSDAEVIRASKFVQEFTRTHQITETQFQTMVEEIWRSNRIMRGDAFQAQTEKNNTVGDIAKYVDNEEGFFSNALQALTGGLKERRMFATFVEYRTRLNNVPMGDVLHIFNENVPGATRFYHPVTNPVTSFTNMWVDKLDVRNIPKSANFAANKARILLPAPQNISDEGRLYLRKLFNTIWTKQQENNNNDATKLIKDTIHIPESVV